ncbi:MAG: DUF3823 domain-containing protein [Agriterribacter sp.]
MQKSFLNWVLIALLAVSCSKVDNYDAPNGNIYGVLTDRITQKPLQAQQPNGFTIQLFEEGKAGNVPVLVPGKPDGTFENAFIFQSSYRVVATEGAFFPVEPQTVAIGSRTEVNFEVMPFLAITDATVTPSAGKVTATYKIAREQADGKILEKRLLVSKIPTVNSVVFDFQKLTDLSGIADEDVLADSYTDEVGGLTSGQTYYVRIAARTRNTLNKYNYSEVFTVTVP